MTRSLTIESEFRGKYGLVLKRLATNWGAMVKHDVQSREYVLVFLEWTTRHQLEAMIGIAVEVDGLEIGSFLNGWNVQSGRHRSWDTPPSKLRFRLQQIKDHLEDFEHPPQEEGFRTT